MSASVSCSSRSIGRWGACAHLIGPNKALHLNAIRHCFARTAAWIVGGVVRVSRRLAYTRSRTGWRWRLAVMPIEGLMMRLQLCEPRACAVALGASVFAAALLLAPAVASAQTGSPQAKSSIKSSITSSITVEGNRRIEADTIRSYFHVQPGGRLDAAVLDA